MRILSEGTLQQIGFQLQVDMKRQMITLTSPLAFRKNVNIYLRPQTRNWVTFQPKGVRPLSGYVNMSHAFNHARFVQLLQRDVQHERQLERLGFSE